MWQVSVLIHGTTKNPEIIVILSGQIRWHHMMPQFI